MGNNNRYEEADVFLLSTSKNCSKKSNFLDDFRICCFQMLNKCLSDELSTVQKLIELI